MQYGRFDTVRVLDSTTVALMRTIQDTMLGHPDSYIGITWWYFYVPPGDRWCWGHTGGWFGASASMLFCPTENSGAILIANARVNTLYCLVPWSMTLLDYAAGYGIAETPPEKHTNTNQFPGATVFSGPLILPEDKACRVFDITGRQIHTLNPAPGIYFIELDGEIKQKVIKIRYS